jgi:hypothetical protein
MKFATSTGKHAAVGAKRAHHATIPGFDDDVVTLSACLFADDPVSLTTRRIVSNG